MSNDRYDRYVNFSDVCGGSSLTTVAKLLVALNDNLIKLEATNAKRNELLEKLINVENKRNERLMTLAKMV